MTDCVVCCWIVFEISLKESLIFLFWSLITIAWNWVLTWSLWLASFVNRLGSNGLRFLSSPAFISTRCQTCQMFMLSDCQHCIRRLLIFLFALSLYFAFQDQFCAFDGASLDKQFNCLFQQSLSHENEMKAYVISVWFSKLIGGS